MSDKNKLRESGKKKRQSAILPPQLQVSETPLNKGFRTLSGLEPGHNLGHKFNNITLVPSSNNVKKNVDFRKTTSLAQRNSNIYFAEIAQRQILVCRFFRI